MENKKEFTKNILNKIFINSTKDESIKNINKENDTNSFIMVPINHPNIEAIMKLLNDFEDDKKIVNEDKEIEIKREIITLNDIISKNTNVINIPENSIITPMAKDHIKKYKIKIIYTKD
ncbi:hypothetical protein [Paraclostridium bifermentans]|uniref:hypothetical protein n=1 Tax=Paraclostridium bifermentans TaxID=1490 RepID=UPI00359C792C